MARKGFDEPCFNYFTVGGISKVEPIKGVPYEGHRNSEIRKDACLACPTQDDLRTWLRERFRLHITISVHVDMDNCDSYDFSIYECVKQYETNWKARKYSPIEGGICENDYDYTLELALEKALNLIP
jgi:hypothetical protein